MVNGEATAVAGYADAALNITILIIAAILIIAFIAGIVWLILWWRKYQQYDVTIFSKDGSGSVVRETDDGGIFVDSRTKNKRLFLRKNAVGLDPDNVPFIHSKGRKRIYLFRTGLKNFHFIKMGFKDPALTLQVGEEDVNWALNAYDRQKKIFQQNLIMQLLPFIMLAFVCVIILVIFIYFFKEFGTLENMARYLKEAVDVATTAQAGTTILE